MSILTEFLCKFPTKTGKWKIIHNKVMGSEMILKKKSSRIKPTACCGCSSRHEARFSLLSGAVWGESSVFVTGGAMDHGCQLPPLFFYMEFLQVGMYSSPPQLRYPQLPYFCSYAILNWVPKTQVKLFSSFFP